MRSLIAAELLKLRSTRSAWIPLAAALAVLAGYAVVLATGGALVTTRREIGTATG